MTLPKHFPTQLIAVAALLCLCGIANAQMRDTRAEDVMSAEDYLDVTEHEWERDRYIAKQQADPRCCPECHGEGTIIEGEAGRMTCFKCNGDGRVREAPEPKPQPEPDHKPNYRGQRLRKLEERIARLERELVAIRKLLESK